MQKLVEFRSYKIFRFTILVGTLVVFLSCNTGKGKGYSLEKEQMIEIIVDFQIAKAAVLKYPASNRDSMSKVYFDQIYAIHEVDRFEFEQNINKLEKDPEYYKVIYDEVYERLESIRSDYEPEYED